MRANIGGKGGVTARLGARPAGGEFFENSDLRAFICPIGIGSNWHSGGSGALYHRSHPGRGQAGKFPDRGPTERGDFCKKRKPNFAAYSGDPARSGRRVCLRLSRALRDGVSKGKLSGRAGGPCPVKVDFSFKPKIKGESRV